MSLSEKQEKIQNKFAKVLAEAWDNETFKNKLIASPNETIERFTGEKIDLKEGAKMVVVDQSDSSTFYFNISAKPDFDNMELSEEQLELVAGGGERWELAKAIVKESFHITTLGVFR